MIKFSNHYEELIKNKIQTTLGNKDISHDLNHVLRVVSNTKNMCDVYDGNWNVAMPAAYLHDLVNLPKNNPNRSKASTLSADAAIDFLKSINYSSQYFNEIHHAISAHSFSAKIKCESIEAKIVQDADRLDALGAIGIARLFSVSAQLEVPFYDYNDPFASFRELNDKRFAIDHIFIKLISIKDSMNTEWAQKEALRRFNYIEQFLEQLKSEI